MLISRCQVPKHGHFITHDITRRGASCVNAIKRDQLLCVSITLKGDDYKSINYIFN